MVFRIFLILLNLLWGGFNFITSIYTLIFIIARSSTYSSEASSFRELPTLIAILLLSILSIAAGIINLLKSPKNPVFRIFSVSVPLIGIFIYVFGIPFITSGLAGGCFFVITKAQNIVTQEIKVFPDSCIPLGWVPTSR